MFETKKYATIVNGIYYKNGELHSIHQYVMYNNKPIQRIAINAIMIFHKKWFNLIAL